MFSKRILVLFFAITCIFFFPIFLKGYLPFPGDLLLAEYQPWRSFSFNNIAPGATPNKAQNFDTLRQMYPWRTFSIESIKNNFFPLWNPHNFSGHPLFANIQSSVLFPPTLLYFILPQHIAWTILVMLQIFLSLISVFLLARKYNISYSGGILASFSYALSLYMTSFLEYNIMGHFMYLLPLGILCIEYIIESKKWAFFGFCIVSTTAIFAGHFQLLGGIIAFFIVYSLFRLYQLRKEIEVAQPLRKIIFSIALAIGIGSIQLIPSIELLSFSARSSHSLSFILNNLLIQPQQLIFYLIPDLFGNPAVKNYNLPYSYPSKALYIGIIPFFLSIIGLFFVKKRPIIISLLFTTVLVASIVITSPISYVLYKLEIPVVSSSSPSNFIFMISLGLSILAGVGLDFLKKLSLKKVIYLLSSFWILFGITVVVCLIFKFHISKSNFIYSAVLMLITSFIVIFQFTKKQAILYTSLLILITFLDLFYFFHKFNSFVPSLYFYPETPIATWINKNTGIDRVWGLSYANITSNFQTQIGGYSAEGYDPLYPKAYSEFIQTSISGTIAKEKESFSRSDATLSNGFGENGMDNPYRLKVLSLLGVKYVLDKVENGSTLKTFPQQDFKKITSIKDFNILEYTKATPRYFITNKYMLYSDKNDFTNKFFSNSFNQVSTILLEENPHIDQINQLQHNEAKLISYQPLKVVIKTNPSAPSLLFLSDTYFPGWQATVDNKLTHIYKANYTFRAVKIPAGSHTVVFEYKPKSFTYGLFISIVSIIISFGILFYEFLKK